MKSGRVREVAPPDQLIKGSTADPTKIEENFAELEADPRPGVVESEDEPALAGDA